MALEEIAVEDIRKGQTVLVVYEASSMGDPYPASTVYSANEDGDKGAWSSRSNFYLLADIPTPPPFEVPWGTVQRDKDGKVWDFWDEDRVDGYVGASYSIVEPIMAEEASEYAPFTRLYTVQELIDHYAGLGYNNAADMLEHHIKRGII